MPTHRVHLASLALCICAFVAPPLFAAQNTAPFKGDLQWRLLGPFRGGWGTMAQGIPDQPNVYYFGAAGGGAEGEHMKAAINTPDVHNLIVCTLCSCYPWPVLGLPPYWYKDPSFRARAAREPRKVLSEFGLNVDPEKEIKTWDSSAQIRWFVVPERPEGTDGFTEEQLAALVTPESMMGVAIVKPPGG